MRAFLIGAVLALNALYADSFFSWVPQKYIWNLGISLSCDVKPEGNPFESNPCLYIDPLRLRSGDTIWIQARHLPVFFHEILPKIQKKIILVVNDGDETFPSEVLSVEESEALIGSDKIFHIFAQNCSYTGKWASKITYLPIGIDYHTVELQPHAFQEVYQTVKDQSDSLDEIISSLFPTDKRQKGAFIDFHLNNSNYHGRNGETRTFIANQLQAKESLKGYLHFLPHRISRRELWQQKGRYAFSISPHGNGLDCHRTWEDLMLGCIVIVKTSPLDSIYEGLPVVIVKSWDEITPENFSKWMEEYGDVFTNPTYRQKLTHQYWMNKIQFYKKLAADA